MKKYSFIEQIILSLQPKKKYVLIEYLPNFDSYDNENEANPTNHEQLLTIDDEQTFDHDGSLSEQLYKEIEQQTTTKTLPNGSTTISLNILLFILTNFVQRKT